jgi:histone-lysine N-methyltransferase ASH1L
MNMPSKRKVPEFYQRITNPIDLGTIEQNIATGVYLTPESFNADMNRLFANYVRFYGRTNEAGVAAIKLKKVYAEAKQQSLPKFENVLGKKPPPNFVKNKGSRSKGVSSTVCSRRGIFFCPFQTRKKTSFGVSAACRATKV